MAAASNRINFSRSVTRQIAENAMLICSNPFCLRFTGYSTTEGKSRAIAEAAHIAAAGKKGPRADSTLSTERLRSAENGIWLR